MQSWIDGDQVRLKGRTYAGSFPLSDLDRWVAFYDKLHRKSKGGSGGFYAETLAGLRELQRKTKVKDEEAKT